MPSDKYRIFYADPPWEYSNVGIIGPDDDHYGHDICENWQQNALKNALKAKRRLVRPKDRIGLDKWHYHKRITTNHLRFQKRPGASESTEPIKQGQRLYSLALQLRAYNDPRSLVPIP